MQNNKLVSFIFAIAIAVAIQASADLIAYDPFDYSAGDVSTEGGSGWATGSSWGATSVSGALTYTDLPSSGSVSFQSTQSGGSGDGFRAIDTTVGSPAALAGVVAGGKIGADGSTVWISFLGRAEGTAWFTNSLYDGTTERKALLHNGSASDTDYRLIGGQTAVAETSIALALIRIDYAAGTDALSAWINPVLANGEGGLGAAAFTDAGNYTFDQFGIRDGGAGTATAFFVDELRVGTTFMDVATTIPEPSSLLLAAPGLGVIACVRASMGRGIAATAGR